MEFCGDGLESHKDRRSRWVLLVLIILEISSPQGFEPQLFHMFANTEIQLPKSNHFGVNNTQHL